MGRRSVSGYLGVWVEGGAITSWELNLWLMHVLRWAARNGEGVWNRAANPNCQHQAQVKGKPVDE